ncbi:MAG: winged helix-turn-helix transcriptional regulator [Actinobacteria bacterium]|jgi:DNA-binding transcriptional ArsR family regulator|nr:winged helix-turn-helix transcriptional regulator [Actinomycetota bacterium]
MRLVDLRAGGPASAPTVEARASSGAELLRCAGVLIADDPASFDVGADRIAAVRDRTPDDLLDELRALSGERGDKALLLLAGAGALVPAPGTVQQVREALLEDALLPWRLLVANLAFADHQLDGATNPVDLVQQVIEGDEEAFAALCRLDAAGECPAELEVLLRTPPAEYRDRLVAAIDRFETEVFTDLQDEAMGAIERDVVHRRRQLDDGVAAAKVVIEATNGYELTEDDRTLQRVVLLPSFWFRPWLILGRLDAIEVLSTPVADEFVALPSEAPPPTLVKLAKALGDEGRLRLLRRMSGGPITLADAMGELDVAKATAHHHLALLRQAGLVSLREEGRRTHYGLRGDPSDTAAEALAAYLRAPGWSGTAADAT